MKKLSQWHRNSVYGEPHHNELNRDMANQLDKMESITYADYSKMCKKQGICAMNEETFNVRYDRFKK